MEGNYEALANAIIIQAVKGFARRMRRRIGTFERSPGFSVHSILKPCLTLMDRDCYTSL